MDEDKVIRPMDFVRLTSIDKSKRRIEGQKFAHRRLK